MEAEVPTQKSSWKKNFQKEKTLEDPISQKDWLGYDKVFGTELHDAISIEESDELSSDEILTLAEMETLFKVEVVRWLAKNGDRLFTERCKTTFAEPRKTIKVKRSIGKENVDPLNKTTRK